MVLVGSGVCVGCVQETLKTSRMFFSCARTPLQTGYADRSYHLCGINIQV